MMSTFGRFEHFLYHLEEKTRYELWRFEIQFVLNGKVYIHLLADYTSRSKITKRRSANVLMKIRPGATTNNIYRK